ncbi:MAG: hypothetical protein WC047_01840 [Kiritimatiellales bacterium]
MNIKKIEKWLLLEQSGELSPRQLRRLNRELAVSDEARRLRKELGGLKRSILIPVFEPSPWTFVKIAARLRGQNRSSPGFYRVLKPALAVAACLTLVTGLWNFHEEQTSSVPAAIASSEGVDVWDDPLEEDLGRLETLIASISGDSLNSMEM